MLTLKNFLDANANTNALVTISNKGGTKSAKVSANASEWLASDVQSKTLASYKVKSATEITATLEGLTVGVTPSDPSEELFDHLVSEMQTGVAVNGSAITGTLHFIEGGLSPAGYLSGDGWFLALKFTADNWSDFTSVKVGLDPSQESGLVEILTDPDKEGVFKITNTNQVFKVVMESADDTVTETYSLAGLVLSNE